MQNLADEARSLDFFENLNEAQKNAVKTTLGPVMMLAGAGSGKTTVLTRRTAYLIQQGINAADIMVVTFTNKAANELKHRIKELIGGVGGSVVAGTFHSIIYRFILRPYTHLLAPYGLKDNFVILDMDDSNKLLKQAIKSLDAAAHDRIRELNLTTSFFQSNLSLIRAKGLSPVAYKSTILPGSANEEFEKLIVLVWDIYTKMCRNANGIDFDDILLVASYLLTNPQLSVASRLSKQFRYIMVDEYQDTNPVQMQIIDAIAETHRNIGVVGDERQSIYGFRGSDINVILNFSSRYPDAKMIDMRINYRSTGKIVSIANAIAGGMHMRLSREEMEPGSFFNQENAPQIHAFDNEFEEAAWISCQIQALLDNQVSANDIAILYRNRLIKRVIEDALISRRIPYIIIGDVGFFQRKEIKDAISLLRILAIPDDNVAFLRIIESIKIGIGHSTLQRKTTSTGVSVHNLLRDMIERQHVKAMPFLSLFEKFDCTQRYVQSPVTFDNYLMVLNDLLDLWRQWFSVSLKKYCAQTLKSKGVFDDESFDELYDSKLSNVNFLMQHVCNELFQGKSFQDVMDDLSLLAIDMTSHDNASSSVQLMTIHASKGLEFNHVFLMGLEDEICPGVDILPESLDEERRIFYVGATRSKEDLVLTHAYSRMINGRTYNMHPSRFLTDILDLCEYIDH